MVLLRGVNLGGDCKLPARPDGRTHIPDDFSDHRTVSFVGRPFPLDEAEGHFRRLSHWGFNCLRLLTTWEAVEHAGPGLYDDEYLDYLAAISRMAGHYGFYVFIDMHQDVWSRMSGGDGAPGWTFEAVGLDFTKFDVTDSAHVMQHRYDPALGGVQDSYPVMSWGRNYRAPANGIMWTLFFAGSDFAAAHSVNGANVQDYLQDHYLGSMRQIAIRVADQPHVIGFDTLNEPGEGWIGRSLERAVNAKEGLRWSPLAALAVASGLPTEIEYAEGGVVGQKPHIVNRDGISIWLPGSEDPFRTAGAWDIDGNGRAVALEADYFRKNKDGGNCTDVDYMLPFFGKVANTIRSVRDDWMVFAELSPSSSVYKTGFPEGMPTQTVNASHWYDLEALLAKQFLPQSSGGGCTQAACADVEEKYVHELAHIKHISTQIDGGVPTLIGECGYQFDMNDRESFNRYAQGDRTTAVWTHQIAALDTMYNAFDRLLLNSTLWNYTASNRNDPMIGDGWNQEDLSIFSLDQLSDANDPDSGGRAIEGFCRPYVKHSQGTLLAQKYDLTKRWFTADIDIDPSIAAASEIYVPQRLFGTNPQMVVISGSAQLKLEGQVLHLTGAAPGILSVRIISQTINCAA